MYLQNALSCTIILLPKGMRVVFHDKRKIILLCDDAAFINIWFMGTMQVYICLYYECIHLLFRILLITQYYRFDCVLARKASKPSKVKRMLSSANALDNDLI